MSLPISSRYHLFQPVVLTADFIIPFPIFGDDDVTIYVDGEEVELYSLTANYVSGRAEEAMFSLLEAVTDVDVEIYGTRAPHRENNYRGGSPELADNLQNDVDALTAVQQEQARDFSSSLRVSAQDPDVRPLPGTASERSGRAVIFSGDGKGLELGPVADEIATAQQHAVNALNAASSISPYPDRAAAVEAEVPSSVEFIRVKTPGGEVLNYAETDVLDRRVALTTNGGSRFWAPADLFVCPQHYAENTIPGTTNLIEALDAMAAGIAHSVLAGVAYPDYAALYRGARSGAPSFVSFLGEPVGISRPWILGALDTDLDDVFNVGPGAIYGLKLARGRLAVLDGFDATPLATHNHPTEGVVTTVPAYAMVLGTYELTDKKTEQENVFYVDGVSIDNTFEIDCNFVTGGVYVTNTNRSTIDAPHIFNLGKNTMGIRTAVSDDVPTRNHIGNFNPMTGAPFPADGAQSKNPELRISRVSISGRNRQAGVDFPPGETDQTMGTLGLGLYTADFHLDAPIVTATTRSIEFDMFRNAQFYASHTWSDSIIYGPDCANIITYGGYWDYTDIVMYSFEHPLVGCSWGAGSSNLRLVATTANEDADGLLLTGCKFYNTSTINYASEGSGSWVVPLARKHVISGGYSEAGDIPQMQIGNTLRLGADNTLTFSHEGVPSAYLAAAADGSFLMVPFDSNGASNIDKQMRYDANKQAWRIGRQHAGSNGNGIILRAPDGGEFLLAMGNGGVIDISPA